MSKTIIILLLFVILEIGNANVLIMTVKNANSAIALSNKLWNRFNNSEVISLNDLNESLAKIQKSLQNIEASIENIDDDLSKLFSIMNNNTSIENKLHQLNGYVNEINLAFSSLNKYIEANISNPLLEQLATWSISQSPSSVSGILKKINSIVMPKRAQDIISNDIIGSLLELSMTSHYMCTMQQTSSQLFFNMYSTLMLTEIKGYTIVQFSRMILEIINKENYQKKAKFECKQFQAKIKSIVDVNKIIIAKAGRDLWRCDPKKHKKGKTYLALTQLLQGYIENEIEMSSEQTCIYNCVEYQETQSYGRYRAGFSLTQSSCRGKILNCRFIESDMTVCQSDRNSDRRYEWIEYRKGTKYGEKKDCKNKPVKVYSWWLFDFKHFFKYAGHCTYCMCICDDPSSKSVRYFSLRAELSNIKKNRVIVGLRFVNIKQVIYIQICEGTLAASGKINRESVTWKKITPINLKYTKNYVDYYQMSYKERAINLQNVEGPPGHVLTGVRFAVSELHLSLEIQTTSFDIKTGKLQSKISKWKNYNNIPNTELELKLTEPDVPTKFSVQSLPDSSDNQYILFTHTDFKKDAAQTTVPYLDAQPVIPKTPVPLSGAGIFHKGFQGSGGFVAFKIYSYNFKQHI